MYVLFHLSDSSQFDYSHGLSIWLTFIFFPEACWYKICCNYIMYIISNNDIMSDYWVSR